MSVRSCVLVIQCSVTPCARDDRTHIVRVHGCELYDMYDLFIYTMYSYISTASQRDAPPRPTLPRTHRRHAARTGGHAHPRAPQT